jgi:hypothetical protein
MNEEKQTTNQDILEAINASSSAVQEQLDGLKSDVAYLKETSVTTAIFQRALDAVEDRLTTEIRGQNRKLIAMARLLEQKKIFSAQEVQELFA